jgi:adenine-specific DNA methylase
VVACRKIKEDKATYFEDIAPEIEDKIKEMLGNLTLEVLLGLPMTDLLIMTYGKVLEETTQHTILKSYRADFIPEFETLIKDARDTILREIVKKLTDRSPTMLGPDISFYIITKVFYRGILDSNEAVKVAWAYSIDLLDLERKQVAKKHLGITKLLFFDEVHIEKKPEEVDRNNLHEQLLYLERIAEVGGVGEVVRTVSHHSNFRIHDLKQIMNLLIKSFRIRFNKKELLTAKEQKELKILESLADIFGSSMSSVGGGKTLEEFMQ